MTEFQSARALMRDAIRKDYQFVLESIDELVFFKDNPPALSRQAFYTGSHLMADNAFDIIEHGLNCHLTVRFYEEVTHDTPNT